MGLFTEREIVLARAVAAINATDPFSRERMDLERLALGRDFQPEPHPFWALVAGSRGTQGSRRAQGSRSTRGNVQKLTGRIEQLVTAARERIIARCDSSLEELAIYDDLVLHLLLYEFLDDWGELYAGADAASAGAQWDRFATRFDYWLRLPGLELPSSGEKVHLFAMLYQVYRAFFNIFDCVVGQSEAAARLRTQIWQSIFTHDMRRYRRSLYRTMQEVTTLVTGPSGSGKELVAQAIGRSRYIPYSAKKRQFASPAATSYVALNVSAFSVNLIESELFGYAKGAFTGAEGTRVGWLETCGRHGTILLDEIGELEPTTQVKLLRLLQNRQYQRVGESKLREFHGKIVTATNRDLRSEIRKGAFREDLYYRLCADVVTTPALAEHLLDDPSCLSEFVRFIAERVAPGEHKALADQVLSWIERGLPASYHWPGNIRELEQCVRNIMIRNHYHPDATDPESSSEEGGNVLADQITGLSLSADELLTRYACIAYQQTGSYKQAAERLGIDRRTLRSRVVAATR